MPARVPVDYRSFDPAGPQDHREARLNKIWEAGRWEAGAKRRCRCGSQNRVDGIRQIREGTETLLATFWLLWGRQQAVMVPA